MTEALEATPDTFVSVDRGDGAVTFTVDEAIYPLEAIYGATFTFIDRCFVFLGRDGEGRVQITLGAKKLPADDEAIRGYVGELANELLACAWRSRILEQNRATIEAVTMQAVGGAMGPPSLDELEDFDFSEEPFEDPLGIAMSWEEKYGKKKGEGSAKDGGEEAASDDATAEGKGAA
jgi:His-Xaa-Ser system protein HxsD